MSKPSAAAPRRGARRSLTEDEILDAALALLDEGGVNAASLRAIATRVGVAPNAIYTYFRDKAAVQQALVERLLGEVNHDLVADAAQPWRLRVEALALELRQRLAAHPGAVPLILTAPMDGPNALSLNARLIELLADADLPPADALRASNLLIVYVFGSVALDVADAASPASDAGQERGRRTMLAAARATGHPRIAAAAATAVAAFISTDQFLWGLNRLLDGLPVGGAP